MAWNKRDDLPSPPAPTPSPAPPPRPAAAPPAPAPAAETPRRNDRTVIGPTIVITGGLTGDEDVMVEGRVEGKIELKQNSITIGTKGKVKADLYGRVITIEGEVDGNLFAREQAVVRPSGTVHGNITAPRVVLEDGARFKGGIDMEAREATAAIPATPAKEVKETKEAERPETRPFDRPATTTAPSSPMQAALATAPSAEKADL
jgi:cytoskeletal protein CcmA (bactofilin family)